MLENGGTVTVAVPSIPTNFNPSVPAGAGRITSMITDQVWPSAFAVSNRFAPVLNSAFVTSAYLTSVKPQTIVYTIASGARWSDGEPITAADFNYFWHEQLVYGPQLPVTDPIAGYEDIRSVIGSGGGRTVTVVFYQPYSAWEALFADLVPAHVARESGFAAAFGASIQSDWVSGGPFMITKYVPGVEVELSRNPMYWGTPARVENIVFKVAAGDRAVLAQLRTGGVDMGTLTPGTPVRSLVARSSGALTASTSLSTIEWQVVFNLARPTFAVPGVRQAIGKAIDRQELLADTVQLLSPGTPPDGNRLFAAGAPGSQGNDGGYADANDTKADNLLVGLGYTIEPTTGVVLTPTGAPFVLTLVGPLGSPMVLALEALLESQLLAAGITLEVKNVPESQLLGVVLPKGEFEMALAPYTVCAFPSETEDLYTNPVGPTPLNVAAASSPSSSAPLPGALTGLPKPTDAEPGALDSGSVSRNVLGFSDPEITLLYDEAAEELAPPEQIDIYNQIDRELWRDLPTLPLFQQPVTLVYGSDILNVSNSETWAGPLWNAQDWVIELSPLPGSTTTTTVPGTTPTLTAPTTTAPRAR